MAKEHHHHEMEGVDDLVHFVPLEECAGLTVYGAEIPTIEGCICR